MRAGVRPGQVLGGKYRVERVLGVAMRGTVLAAHDERLDERVVIKLPPAGMLEGPEAAARLVRGAEAAAKMTSEHAARMLDVGMLDERAPYFVVEFLHGGNLDTWLHVRGALPIEQAVDFVLQACVAVAEAHELRLVHGDLRPATLFCTRHPDGQLSIKVLDFGVPKRTPRSEVQDDLRALGVTLYELLTATRVTALEPAPARGIRPDIPLGLEAIILRCLDAGGAAGYRRVTELAIDLARFGSWMPEQRSGIYAASSEPRPARGGGGTS